MTGEKELMNAILNVEDGDEITIYGLDGTADDIMPDLAMGVRKDRYFDSDTPTYLCGVYGGDCNFASFFCGDYDTEEDCVKSIIIWLNETAFAMCGNNYEGLSLTKRDK